MSFWRRELAGAPLITQLAVDDPNLPAGSRQPPGGPISLELSSELCDGLRELARRERATLFMTVLAAFGVLVARHTGEDDLLLATVVANRNRTELEGLIGCFTKKVPLRLRLSGDPSFGEVLSRTRSGLLGALAHQDLPFEGVVQEVLGASAASYGLVPRVPIVFQGVTPQHELALPDMETAGLETSAVARRAHFMATVPGEPADTAPDVPWGAGLYLGTFVIVSLSEVGDRLSLSARGAFHGPAVSELMRSFRTLLADIAAHPARRLSDVAVLDERGRDDALRRGLGPVACQTGDTVYALFAAQVRQTPDAIALEERGGRLTFSALAAEAERLADRLRALGVGPGERVGISLRPSAELVVAVLAVWNAGAAWVGLDPADTEDRRNWIGRDASLAVVVAAARGPDADGRVRIVTSRRKSPPADAGGYSAAPARPGDGAVVFYGSGPSAVARGVLLDQRAVLGLLEGLRDAVYSAPEEPGHPRRVCLSAGPAGDAFLRQLVALLDGHCLRVPDTPIDDDPREALALLGAGEVDLLHCTVDELQALQEAGLARVLDSREHRLTPGIIVGTRSAVGPELWHTLGRVAGARAHLLFGPPECAFGATVAAVGRSAPRGVGRSMTGIRSHILDSHGRPVPTGAVGELHLGGPSLARGYLGDPEASRTRFVELSIQGVPTRLHRTDQLARSLPDGGVELLGPLHGGEHLRGFRINHARIRSALRRAPGIRDVVLEQGSDDRGEQRLLAKVVAEGKVPTPGRLRAILWSALPGYAWPSTVVAVPGQRAATHADAVATERPPRASAAGWRPEPSWQRRMLTALWAEVLGLEEVSAQENYWQRFSFLEALARAREAGMPVPSHQVMRNRTLDTLAASLAVPPSTISGFR
jgi:non-ribosomal peptide synthetase component F